MVLSPDSAASALPESVTPEFPKLSTTLLEFASPLLASVGGRETAARERFVLELAWLAWNCGAPRTGTEDRFASARAALESSPIPEVTEAFRALLTRRRDVFGHDPRTAGEMRLTESQGQIDRIVVPSLDTPALRAHLADPSRPDPRAGLHPAFAAFVRAHGLDHRFVAVGVPRDLRAVPEWGRRRVRVRWHGETATWEAPPLRELVRGTALPPTEADMSRYPERYVPLFSTIDIALVEAAEASGRDPLDREVADIVSAIRRRPDGPSARPEFVHDVVWQHLAVELGRTAWSAAEVEGVLRQIERSVRRHRTDPVSREYVAFVREQFSGPDDRVGDAVRLALRPLV